MADGTEQASSNGKLHAQTRRRLAESQSLQRMTAALLQPLTLEEILEVVRREAREVTGASRDGVYLLEDESWLRVTGDDTELAPHAERIPVAGTFAGQAVLSGKPVLVNDYPRSVIASRAPGVSSESLLAVPLQVEGIVIGALNVANKPLGFDEEDVRVLSLLADVAAIAIQNARLRQQAKRLAIMEERQWLARELHDSVTQALYSVTLYAEATRMALAAGKQDVAADNLQELQAMAREALVDIRLLIFELHPPILEGQGLAAALRIRLAAVESRAGLQAAVNVKGARRLPISLEEDLFRIALEALNNVVKHAKAQHVTVNLVFADQCVSLEVSDDGVGYGPQEALESGGVGLRGMEERATRINGKLESHSAPGKGTTVKLEVQA